MVLLQGSNLLTMGALSICCLLFHLSKFMCENFDSLKRLILLGIGLVQDWLLHLSLQLLGIKEPLKLPDLGTVPRNLILVFVPADHVTQVLDRRRPVLELLQASPQLVIFRDQRVVLRASFGALCARGVESCVLHILGLDLRLMTFNRGDPPLQLLHHGRQLFVVCGRQLTLRRAPRGWRLYFLQLDQPLL